MDSIHLRNHTSVSTSREGAILPPAVTGAGELGEQALIVDEQASTNAVDREGPGSRATARSEVSSWYLADGEQVMNLEFDLSSPAVARDGLHVVKPLRVDGREVGDVAITINANSRLYISASDLRRVLPRELAGRVDEGAGFLAFDALREAGIVIRYDPVADTLQIAS